MLTQAAAPTTVPTTAPIATGSSQRAGTGPGRGGLATIGLVGGLVPSPSALVLLLGAVALDRAWFGVVLVVSFGVGMAVTLALVGLVATDLLGRLERFLVRRGRLAGPVRSFIAYGAALGVCVIGLGVMVRALGGVA